MVQSTEDTKIHPTESELANYLSRALTEKDRERVEDHVACCNDCLENVVSAYESVKAFKKGKTRTMKKINIYLILAIISFVLSFTIPQYFVQFLTATLILGIKWIVDAKSTRMLIMIYEAWKNGGEKEASRILNSIDKNPKNRL